eukprot:scaffold89155_cov54-Phaeocystis_antarctica.AAC.1
MPHALSLVRVIGRPPNLPRSLGDAPPRLAASFTTESTWTTARDSNGAGEPANPEGVHAALAEGGRRLHHPALDRQAQRRRS